MEIINLINQLLNDEDGISESAYLALVDYLNRVGTTQVHLIALRSLTKQVQTANGRYYLAQDLELINE